MKKTLVAIAALAATGAMAQSAFQITGYADRGYLISNSTDTKASTRGLGSNAGTTRFEFRGNEDLGGGNSAGFFVETDWADLAGISQGTSTTATSANSSGFANSESYFRLTSAQLGELKLGSVNNDMLGIATSVASPAFSTGVGSAYSSKFSTLNGEGTGVTGSGGIVTQGTQSATNGGVRAIRMANTVKYTTPSFSGLTVSLAGAANNTQGTAGTGQTVGMSEQTIRYINGPLDAAYTQIKYTNPGVTATNGSLTADLTNKHSMYAASYAVLPTVKLHAGLSKSLASTASVADSKGKQYGVTWNVTPVIDVLAQQATVTDNNTADFSRKMTGLGVDYKFSKTTRAYFRYDSLNFDTNHAASAGSEIKRTAVGLSQAF